MQTKIARIYHVVHRLLTPYLFLGLVLFYSTLFDNSKPVIRCATINREEIIIISGESHKTREGGETLKHYEASEVFGLENIAYRWSALNLITLDKIPYIGEITSGQKNVFINTLILSLTLLDHF
ncbi:hypothetical protein [Bacillus cereus]|uniref:hypothetical protein n=1 Tax=Bacillus cereus TaxID=1396 RepID=UPI001D0D578C